MIVNSRQLEDAAATVLRKRRAQRIPAEDVVVSASQLKAAARLLREAAPSVIRAPIPSVKERPGFIERSDQDDPKVLMFRIGILPHALYRIDRRGRVEPVETWLSAARSA